MYEIHDQIGNFDFLFINSGAVIRPPDAAIMERCVSAFWVNVSGLELHDEDI